MVKDQNSCLRICPQFQLHCEQLRVKWKSLGKLNEGSSENGQSHTCIQGDVGQSLCARAWAELESSRSRFATDPGLGVGWSSTRETLPRELPG